MLSSAVGLSHASTSFHTQPDPHEQLFNLYSPFSALQGFSCKARKVKALLCLDLLVDHPLVKDSALTKEGPT